jgi:hypothetical protein
VLGQYKNRFYRHFLCLIFFLPKGGKSMNLGRFGYSSGLFSPARAAETAAGKTGALAKWRRG